MCVQGEEIFDEMFLGGYNEVMRCKFTVGSVGFLRKMEVFGKNTFFGTCREYTVCVQSVSRGCENYETGLWVDFGGIVDFQLACIRFFWVVV